MERKKYLLITAGGSGTRMGGPRRKQFLEIEGKAILHHTISRFTEAFPDIRVVTVLPEPCMQDWRDYCYAHNFQHPQFLVKGGITRFHSVRNGLEKVPDGAVVAVHDGVRPLVSPDLIRQLFEAAVTCPAVVPVVRCVDTMKVIDVVRDPEGREVLRGASGEHVDRSRLFGAQTPQVFHSELLRAAYGQAFDPAFTDDASVVEAYGHEMKYLEGDRYNIKITTPDDMVIAEALLRARG